MGVYAKGEIIRSFFKDWFVMGAFQVEAAESIEMRVGEPESKFKPRGYALELSGGHRFLADRVEGDEVSSSRSLDWLFHCRCAFHPEKGAGELDQPLFAPLRSSPKAASRPSRQKQFPRSEIAL